MIDSLLRVLAAMRLFDATIASLVVVVAVGVLIYVAEAVALLFRRVRKPCR